MFPKHLERRRVIHDSVCRAAPDFATELHKEKNCMGAHEAEGGGEVDGWG